jgi:RNA polymerase-binding transcription factor DksA
MSTGIAIGSDLPPPARSPGAWEDAQPSPNLPVWRSLLEARWQQRLVRLTELSLAYHDAAGRSRDGGTNDVLGRARLPQRLLREATAARRALCDTEEALARISGGRFGQCEQCSVPITTAELLTEPETRYCGGCRR